MRRKRSAPLFSIATIVRNEAVLLPRLLDSVREFRALGGEVVVLDTGSHDNTIDVAREAGCVVVDHGRRFNRVLTPEQADRIQKAFSRNGEGPCVQPGDRVFNFAAAREAADARAVHPFILAVDASDVVEIMDVPFVNRQIEGGRFDVLPFETRRLHQGAWMLELRDYFHDRRTMKWFGRAHNHLSPREPAAKPRVGVLPRECLRITHHTQAEKARSYQVAGLALDVLARPRAVHRRLLLGHELASRGFFASALALFMSVDQEGAAPALRSAALSMASHCVAGLGGSDDEVGALLFKAARRDPSHRHPLLQLARRALAAGRFQAAASFASAALAIPPRVGSTELETNLKDGPHAVLYWALLWLGRKAEAAEHFKVCLTTAPTNPLYRDHARFFA